ncbi:DUF1015 domain-containing protein [Chloroflexota bacterium]
MPEIRPFRGVHYNQSLARDLAALICPPYDIITPEMQQELYQKSEYNFVRLELNRELLQDHDSDNKYSRSATTLEQWLQQGVLTRDEVPAIYLHDHYFVHQGREYRRRGIIVAVRLEEQVDEAAVRPHEGTLAAPKSDRLNLLSALKANTSSIFTLFEDPEHQVKSLLESQEQGEPMFEINVGGGERHIMRAITDTGVIRQVNHYLAARPLYIADGHHRYESALNYRRERSALSLDVSAEEPFNFVMMTLVDIADPGLIILPAHRLVRGMSASTLNGLTDKLKEFFEIEEVPFNLPDVWQRIDDLLSGGEGQVKLVLFGPEKEKLLILRLRDFAAAEKMMPSFCSDLYKRLDVSILDHIILEKLLELTRDKEEASLGYSYNMLDAIKQVLEQQYQLALLLSPPGAGVIKAIADAGDRMPRKSTYFHPKLPSGLIINRLV